MPLDHQLVSDCKKIINGPLLDLRTKIYEILKDDMRRKELENLPFEDIVYMMGILLPQSYGSQLGKIIINRLGFSATDDIDRGDAKSNGKYFEIKVSILNTDRKLNLVQIRPWQQIFSYIILYAQPGYIQFFCLSALQMSREVIKNGNSAHGTKKANAENKKPESSIRLPEKGSEFKRWVKDYGISFDSLKRKFSNA